MTRRNAEADQLTWRKVHGTTPANPQTVTYYELDFSFYFFINSRIFSLGTLIAAVVRYGMPGNVIMLMFLF